MRRASKDVISFKTPLKRICESEVGGKAWNLFRLFDYGFPGSPYCAVSSRLLEKVMGLQKKAIEEIISTTDFGNQGSIERTSARIRNFISNTGFPRKFSQELLKIMDKMFGKEVLFSVRSSVVGEDSAQHSFAGQMDSFLNVRKENAFEAIRKVWASAFSTRALLYRKEKHIGQNGVLTAVILQKMVQSESSGIMFTRNPENGEKEFIISAGFGLGEGIVSNRVETDTYRIGWETDEISKEVRSKDFRIVLDASSQSGNRIEPVPEEMKSKQVLGDAQVRKLRKIGLKAEKLFGSPQDIEWAFDSRGRLYILQARPIVFAENRSPSKPIRIWDNSNIVESYPGLTLPLTFSFVRDCYEIAFHNAARGIVFIKKAMKKRQDIFKNMIGLLDGRIYYNLLNWYEMLSYLPGFKKHKESWDQMIGITQELSFPQSKLSGLNSFFSSLIMLWKLLRVNKTAKRFFSYFNRTYQKFKNIDMTNSSEHELIAIYEELGEELKDKWYLTLHNDFFAMKYYDWLKRLCNKWGLEKHANLHNNLLCAEQGVESVKPVRSLVHLAEMLRSKPLYQTFISEEDNEKIWKKIQNEPAYAPIKAAFDSHLQAYGDRGLEELKLEKPTFREEPFMLIESIKNYFNLGLSLESMDEKELKVKQDAEAVVARHLKNPFKRLVFWFVLKNARMAISNRENMRFARTRIFGIVRRLFQQMSILFVQKGLLSLTSDIYYLTVDEAFSLVQGTAMTQNLKALVSLRKSEYQEFSKRKLKERLETTGIPCLNSLSEDKAENGMSKKLKGINCSSGTAEGEAKVVLDPHSAKSEGNYILVAKSTDPGWVFLMISSKGIVVERGSVLSHTAIIGRELGIPTIVGAKDATKLIPDGARIFINGSTGEIRWQ